MALSKTRVYQVFSVLDSVIALLMGFPLTCLYWRGTWDTIGYYVLRDNIPIKYWVLFSVGNLQMVGQLLLPYLDKTLDRSKRIQFWIITRVFMYIHSVTFMCYWYGLWMLFNHYLGQDWEYSLVFLNIAWFALVLLGSCRSTMWPPFSVSVDDESNMLKANNRFKMKVTGGKWLDYITDAYFSQIIIMGLAVACWRSIFNIFDRLLFPDDKLQSDATSAVIGLVGSIILLSLQLPLGAVSKRLSKNGFLKLVWEDTVYAVTFVILAALWRGVWNLSLAYFIPEKPLGSWVNLALGSVGMIVTHTFTEVCPFGVEDDGLDPGGEAFYPVKYLRIFFKGHCEVPEQQASNGIHQHVEHNVYDNHGYSSEGEKNSHRQVVTERPMSITPVEYSTSSQYTTNYDQGDRLKQEEQKTAVLQTFQNGPTRLRVHGELETSRF